MAVEVVAPEALAAGTEVVAEGSAGEATPAGAPLPPLLAIAVTAYEGDTLPATRDGGVASDTDVAPGFAIPNGRGRATFATGATYDGEWDGGFLHGRGVYTWADGTRYEGDFVHNRASGQGRYVHPNGDVYDGGVRDGLRHGKGKLAMRAASGDVDAEATYDGKWVCGERHGRGALRYDARGARQYEGDWSRGLKHGAGSMTYGGGRYEGSWVQGRKAGEGRMEWAAMERGGLASVYDGTWSDDLPNGRGAQFWFDPATSESDSAPASPTKAAGGSGAPTRAQHLQTANSYRGDFCQGRREGTGVFRYATGARYSGAWLNNAKHGKGTFMHEDGTRQEGMFARDVFPGGSRHGGSRGMPGPSVKVDVSDVEGTAAGFDPELSDAILRFNTELRAIYRRTCAEAATEKGEGGVPSHESGCLASTDAVRACKRLGVTSAGFGAAAVRDAVARVCSVEEDGAADGGEEADIFHERESPVLFKDFVELLVRASMAKYHAVRGGAAPRFARLMESDVLRAAAGAGASPPSPDASHSAAAAAGRGKHAAELKTLFRALASGKEGKEGKGDEVTARRVVSWLAAKGLVVPPSSLASSAHASQGGHFAGKDVVFVLGGPGSGKGTQCEQLVSKYGFTHFSAGDLLRAEVASGSDQGKELEAIMKEGKLVPSRVTIGLLKKAIATSDGTKFLIDGFPRALDQAEMFEEEVCACKLVLFFDCPQNVMQERLMKVCTHALARNN